eukprot:1178483-Prorocentrum_minimum.AAC.7
MACSWDAPRRRPRTVAALVFLCAAAFPYLVAGQAPATRVYKLSSKISPKSCAYDSAHDRYFTHKGKASGSKNGFLSALSPGGQVVAEDFGFCDAENRGLEVRPPRFF